MKIAILGGGISGLSAAWYAKKRYPEAQVQLFEASSRLGGVIDTGYLDDFIYEKGPRTFAFSRSLHLLELIEELGLCEEILPSSPLSKKRYLWHRKELRSISSFFGSLIVSLMKEPFTEKKQIDDETIYDFAFRKFGKKIAETLFDPMALGIYAEDIRKLSLLSCFPSLYEWERQGRSFVSGFFSLMFQQKKKGLFSLKRGIASLIGEMQKQLSIEIFYQTPISALAENGVVSKDSFFPADLIVSALPGPSLGNLTGSWSDFPTTSLWVVQYAFQENVLLKNGFGYLVPTSEKESVLGVVFDSSLFQRPSRLCQTFLTVMLRPSGDAVWAEREALSALERHLNIQAKPFFVHSYLAKDAIPFFKVGYAKRLHSFLQDLKIKYPHLHVCGNYVDGVSVDACISSSKKIFIN